MRLKAIPKQEGPLFSTLWDFPPFSALWDWFFSEFFLLFLPSIFDILQQNGCSKNPKASPLLYFLALCDLPETSKKFRKKIWKIFSSIFSFLRAFVVSSCRTSGFRVFLSLWYGADLGRSRLVSFKFLLAVCIETPFRIKAVYVEVREEDLLETSISLFVFTWRTRISSKNKVNWSCC